MMDRFEVYGPTGQLMYGSELPGPLARALRTLRRVSSLLDEPAPAPQRSSGYANGIFSENLFGCDQGPIDAAIDEDDGPSVAAPPSLAEEWVGLIDRTFLNLRRRWQAPNLGTVGTGNPYFESTYNEPSEMRRAAWRCESKLADIADSSSATASSLALISESLDKLLMHAEESAAATAARRRYRPEAVKASSATAVSEAVASEATAGDSPQDDPELNP